MNSKLIGGIMLVVGTAVGGGMLALPVVTGTSGFFPSVMLFTVCWLVTALGALMILEVALWLPLESNFITMVGKTLGKSGQLVTWVIYCLLVYALLAAYIAAGTDLTQTWLGAALHLSLSKRLSALLFTVLMGYIVYRGITWVDIINRGLLSSKFLLGFSLIIVLLPFVNAPHLLYQNYYRTIGSTTVALTAFGFAPIVPSLCAYFKGDVRKLRLAIIVGSLIPLFIYITWNAVVQGILPVYGNHSLVAMQMSGNVAVQLVDALTKTTNTSWIAWPANFFTSICVLTSFLSVALFCSDFLADGCKVDKTQNRLKIMLATLLPPLVLVLFIPALFIKALYYAGILCILLLILLPALMVYSGRYILGIASGYRLKGGKILLLVVVVLSIIGIVLAIVY